MRNVKSSLVVVVLLTLALLQMGCKKEKENIGMLEKYADVNFSINYHVDGKTLLFDSIAYVNAVGNKYSVTKLNYYISGVKFYKNDKTTFSSDAVYYIDAVDKSTQLISLKGVPINTYDSLSFLIGLDVNRNVTNALNSTTENVNMSWPDMMGGGYHFVKLEGYWNDSGKASGYAIHIGKNGFAVKCGLAYMFNVDEGNATSIVLDMNINEWFRNPNEYDLSKGGRSSMGNALLMGKLSENGTNVFSVSQ